MKTIASRPKPNLRFAFAWVLALGLVPVSAQNSGQLATLVSFNGTNGASPSGPLVQGTDGNLYGETGSGGVGLLGLPGLGTVFKLGTDGTFTSLVSFSLTLTGGFPDGFVPLGGLVQGPDGNFYGMAQDGGTYQEGTLFKLTPSGVLSPLFSFSGTNGLYPQGGLALDSGGNLYGATGYGGTNFFAGTGIGQGTIFKISTNGTLVWSFSLNGTNGQAPMGIIRARDGNYYGTASTGGTNSSGTILRITPDGVLSLLHTFSGGNDGNSPQAGLVQGPDDFLYGTTQFGGVNGDGTVFRISTNGTHSVLYTFGQLVDPSSGEPLDGAEPMAALTLGKDGDLYGTTSKGGTNGFGTIFSLTPQGALTRLYSFGQIQDAAGHPLDGSSPSAALLLASDGLFYGTTSAGGANSAASGGDGTVFRFSNVSSFPPFIAAPPTNLSVLAGATATFAVAAGGTPPLSYQWQFNGANLADNAHISGSLSNLLAITGVQGGDVGNYQVVVTNAYGSATSLVATLSLAIPPQILQQPTNATANPGAAAFFGVVAGGTPPLSYQWLRDGTNLSDGGDVFGSTESVLRVSPVSAADAGTYSVVVSSPFGHTNSVLATLSVAKLPDLAVSGLTVPQQAWTGGSFQVSWADTNQGQASAVGPWVDDLYLSPDNQTQDAVQFLGQAPINTTLGPGQSVQRVATVTLNRTGVTNGQYHVLVVVNAKQDVNEGPGSANNLAVSSSLQVQVPPSAVLEVSSVTAPTNGLGGQTVGLRWVVCNHGQADTDVPVWYDHLYLSKTNDLSAVVSDFGIYENPSFLAIGDCYEQDVTVPLPVGISGPFYFVVSADSTALLGQDTGSNVVGSTSVPIDIQFVSAGFLHVSSVQVAPAPPTTVWSGDAVTVTWTVENIGQSSITGTWDDEVTLSPTPVYDFVNGYWDVINHIYFTGPLEPGQSYSHTNEFLVPKGITPGNWYAVPIVDTHFFAGGTGAIGSGNIGRDQKSTLVVVAPPIPSDLEVASVSAPAIAYAGQPMNVGWVVSNNGLNQTSSDQWVDNVYLSATGTLDAKKDLRLGSFTHWGLLDLGASYSNNVTLTLPASVLPPNAKSVTNYLFVLTDAGDAVVELTKTNNVLEAPSPLAVLPAPPPGSADLAVSSVSAPSTLLAGGAASLFWTVTNRGTATTTATNWTDSVYLSADGTFNPAVDLWVADLPHDGTLDPGATYTVSQSLTMPYCAVGSYYVVVVADRGHAVNAATNSLPSPAPMHILPDPSAPPHPSLRIATFTLPAALTSAVPWTAQWSVTNAGPGAAIGTWFDGVYASLSPALDSSAVLLAQFEHDGGLSPGATYSQAQRVVVPPCTAGNYYLFVMADISNALDVATACQIHNPARSANALPVNFGLYPDLTVSSLSIPSSANAEQPMTVSWTVSNAGPAMASAPWLDSVYLSDNRFTLANGLLLGSLAHTAPLAPGGTYTQSVPFTLPNVNGNYYVVVVTDATNSFPSCGGETNNTTPSASPVNIQPTLYPDLKVTSVLVPPTAYAGQPILVTWVVTNQGTSTAGPAAWNDAVYLSQNQVLDYRARRLGGSPNPAPLAAGRSYTNSATVVIPVGTAGPFYILMLADSGNVLFQHLGYNDSLGWNPNAIRITLPPPAKLQPASVTISPAVGSAGTPITIGWTVANITTNGTASIWADAVYLSTNTTWDLTATLLADVNHTNLGPLASYSGSWTGPVPGLNPGSYYAIVRADVRDSVPESSLANLVAVSASTISVDVPVLVLGQTVSNQLSTGSAQFYKVNCPAGQTVKVTLTGSSNTSGNELYVRLGAVPDLGTYDFVYSNPLSPNQEIEIPTTQAGWYYLMVRGENEPGGPLGYTLTANIVPFAIASVTPSHIGDNGQVTITVTGAKFLPGASVQLISPANSYTAQTTLFADATTVRARFLLTNAVHGTYDVVLVNPGNQSATAPQAVTIDPALPLAAEVIPGLINTLPRVGLPFNWLGAVANSGNVDIPYLSVAILTTPSFPITLTPPSEAIPSRNNDVFLARDVAPGAALDFSFTVSGFQSQPFYYEIVTIPESKAQFLARVASDAETVREALSDPSTSLTLTVTNTSGNVSTNSVALPSAVASALADTNSWEQFYGQILVAAGVLDTNDLSALPPASTAATALARLSKGGPRSGGCEICETAESSQEKIETGVYVAEALSCTVECAPAEASVVGAVPCFVACMAIPVIHHVMETVVIKVTSIYCEVACFLGPETPPPSPWQPVRPKQPKDPNEKQGPTGYGTPSFVGSQVPWQYTIYFENTSNAPAFARQVSITDRLDPNLDLRTFRVGNIVLGGTTIAAPTNSAHFQTRIALPPPNPSKVVADLSLSVDVQNRSLLWTMNAIDVNTGQLVTDTQQGVLPPNTTNNVGAGYVTFSIKPAAGLRTGTPVTNRASIVFDTNDPLPTNFTTNTVDAVPPTSMVAALPSAVRADTFTVFWSGTDDPGGSGVAGFSIWFSDNGGPYQLWLANTNATSALFNGQFGHIYAFYSAAQDNAGNVEAPHATADTTTFVTSPPVIVPVADQAISVGAALTISNMVTDANQPAPTFTYSLGPNAPAGATIDNNGVFSWAPDCSQGSTTNLIEVVVTASGSPPQTNSMLFNVVVGECVQVGLGSAVVQSGQNACVPVNLLSTVGLTNLTFTLSYPAARFDNWSINANNPVLATPSLQVMDASHALVTVGTRPGQVLQGLTLAGSICFGALSNSSGFIPLEVSAVSGTKSDGVSVGNIAGLPGRVVVVSAAPLLEAGLSTNQLRLLTLYGRPGTSYMIEWKTNLLQGSWTAGWSILMTNLSETFPGVATNGPTEFYRARQTSAQ